MAWYPALAGLCLGHVVLAGSNPTPAIRFAPPPPAIVYTCVVESRAPGGATKRVRLSYDRGSFREELLDSSPRSSVALRVYQRDGQGLAFYSFGLPPRFMGTDIEGIMYRLARDDPQAYARISRIPPGFTEIVAEPVPAIALQPFPPRGSKARYASAGVTTVDGKRCVVYERVTPEGQRGERLAVRGGYVQQVTIPGRGWVFRISRLRSVRRLPRSLFEPPAGMQVKVPADLHVRLPAHVTRAEYPGNGFRVGEPVLRAEGRRR